MYSDILGAEPTWVRCADCQIETMMTRCRSCEDSRLERALYADKMAAAERAIPNEFAWARLGCSELAKRVRLAPSRSFESTVKTILAAKNVTLVGQAGSGKTSLLVACLREVLPGGLFVTSDELAHAGIRSKAGAGEPQLIRDACRVGTLLIDEVKGAHAAPHYSLTAVIEHRWNHDMPTWITTGMQRNALVEAFGEGIDRRLFGERNFALRLMPRELTAVREIAA